MALFKKKKPREIREDDSTFVKLWYNPRTHAMMVLGVYFIFFAIVIIFINLGSNKSTTTKDVNGSTIKESFTNLNGKSLSYNYVVNIGKTTYYFSGSNEHENITGTILSDGIVTPIKVENNECVVGEYNGEEFNPEYKLCPQDINYSYFDYNYIYSIVENIKTNRYKENDKYEFKKDDTTYMIYIKDKKLDKIVITAGENTYTLEYKLAVEKPVEE